jgi:hypothetical protein
LSRILNSALVISPSVHEKVAQLLAEQKEQNEEVEEENEHTPKKILQLVCIAEDS